VESRGNPPGRFVLGKYPDGTDALIAAVAAVLRNAGYEVEVTPEIMPSKWGKLVENLANASALLPTPPGRRLNRIALARANRRQEILARAGIRWLRNGSHRKPSNNVTPPHDDSLAGR